jgi:SPP1 family predicted phage head-tail adaptor
MKYGDDVRAGEMNLLVSLYGTTDTGDPGTSAESLLAAGIAAAKRPLRGREADDSGREISEQWAVFSIRWRSDVDTAKTLTHAGDRWNIDAVDDPTGNRRKLEITARKVR